MNSEVEQRIVAMYFDNKDFEKNAKKTIDTLGELKDNLNLEDSVKGFDELNKAGKKLNLNDAKTTVRNLKDSLSGLGDKFKSALNIGSGPLSSMRGFFDEFNGYVTKVAGIDLAGKIVNSFENAFRQLTVAPIEAGWNMYQQNVDSIKTIMSGTMETYKKQMSETNADWTYDEGEHMEYVKGQLEELSKYAQQTVFSLSDMTNNVGKFTNNNIPLEESVNAMEGIANMTAKAGQGAQQASMAMYNFSQALGVGKMTTLDWKSIENANIATTELKNLFIQTAEAGGRLTKEITKTANGKELERFFITVDKNGKKLAKNKWVEVSAENFRDSLSNGWLDKRTMMRVFQLYSNQVKDVDTLSSWGFDTDNEELVKYLFGIGEQASEAATQVRTFSKMWDAMTESVQSGWAKSMEFIFGDMQEATTFWSTINDKVGSVLDKAEQNRNNMLREWRGFTFNENTGEWKRLEGAVDGREDLIQGIYGVIDAAKSLGSAFSSAWSDVFGNLNGKKLQEITRGFRDFIDRFKTWLGDMDDSNSRIRKIRTGLSGVFSVLKVVANVIKTGLGIALRAIKPFIDPVIGLFDKFGKAMNLNGAKNLGEMLGILKDRFIALWSKLSNLGLDGVFSKIGSWFSDLWVKIREGVSNFLDDNGLSGVKDWFIDVGDKLKEGYETVKRWWESSGIPQFFEGIWSAVVSVFQPSVETSHGQHLESHYGDPPIVKFFVDAWAGIKAALEEVKGWGIWNTIGDFFSGIWETLIGIFQPSVETTYGQHLESHYGDPPIVKFFVSAWESIKNAFEEVRSWGIWATIGDFFSGIWESVMSVFRPTVETTYGQHLESHYGDPPIVKFFLSAWESIRGAFEEVKSWGIWSAIGSFFEGIWNTIIGVFQPSVEATYGQHLESHYGDPPIVKFFKDTWDGIRKTFEDVMGWEIWGQIGEFFSGVWSSVMGFFNGAGDTAEATSDASERITENTPSSAAPTQESVGLLTKIIGAIGDFVKKIVDSVGGITTIDPEINKFFVNLGDLLKGMFKILNRVLGFLARVVGTVGESSFLTAISIFAAIIIGIIVKVKSIQDHKYLSEINTESVASKIMAIGVGLLAISAAIALLSTIPIGDLLKASGVVAVMGIIIGVIANTLAKKSASDAQIAEATKEHRVLEKLVGAIEKIGMVAVALALLPDIIKAFGEAKKMAPQLNGTDIMNTLIGVGAFIASVSLGLALANRIAGPTGVDPAASLKLALSVVGFVTVILAGLLAVSAALDGIFGTENIVSTIEHGGEILNALGGAISGMIGGLIGGFAKGFNMIQDGRSDEEKMDDSLAILEKLGDKLEIFTTDKTAGISRILNLVGLLANTMKDVPKASDFTNFTDSLEPLASSIMKFGLILSGFVVEENQDKIPLEAMKERILALVEIMRAFDIPDFSTIVSSGRNKAQYFVDGIDYLSKNMTPERFDALGNFMANLTEAFNKAMSPEGKAMKTMSGDLMKNLSGAIKIGLGDGGKYEVGAFDAMPIIDSICTALGYGETAIAKAVHNMVQAGIDSGGGQGIDLNGSELITGMTQDDGMMQQIIQQAMGGDVDTKTNEQVQDKVYEILYGTGGSKDAPKENSLMGMMSDMENIKVPNISDKFAEAFVFKKSDTGEDVDPLAEIRSTLADLQEEVDKLPEFQIKIIPTFDYSHLDPFAIREELKKYPIGMPMNFASNGKMSIDMSELAGIIDTDGIKTAIGNVAATVTASQIAIVASIDGMGVQISGLARAISALKLYLDTGVLVGSITPLIDMELGRRANKASYTGVASPFANPYSRTRNVEATQ